MRAIALLAAALTLSSCATWRDEPAPVRAMTFNIRLDTVADGANAWPHRRRAVSSLIAFYSPDIFGLQEVMAHQLEALREDLDAYEFQGVGRDDGASGGEFSPLAFRKSRYLPLESGTYWLSESPAAPSKGFDAAFPRLVTWARLKDRKSNAVILVQNTHFDHLGRRARLESGKMIRDFVGANRRHCDAALVIGDFNATAEEDSYREIVAADKGGLVDARAMTRTPPFGPPGTFNNFDIKANAPSAIDHIFVDGDAHVERYGVITQHEEGRLPSDHYPVVADFVPPECPPG